MKSQSENVFSVDVRDGRVISKARGKVRFDISIMDIAVVGELVTSGGPYLPDHFLVLVTRGAERDVSVAIESAGFDELRGALREERGIEFEFMLANRTLGATAVLWPRELRGRPMYEVHVEKRSGGFVARWLDRIRPRTRTELTAAVRERCGTSQHGAREP